MGEPRSPKSSIASLFALPAGALADIIDKRRFLVAVEIATTVVSAQAGLAR
ncbi:MAG: hypothetical protein E6H66_21965 [Betaproteobacteria bacterium]|nr:MAG: hypothetical protein E6H66_21965 [Betaproteobacteria bacterium]